MGRSHDVKELGKKWVGRCVNKGFKREEFGDYAGVKVGCHRDSLPLQVYKGGVNGLRNRDVGM